MIDKQDYLDMFEVALRVGENKVRNMLNQNGGANLTVCPECREDDFVHVEGCKIGLRCIELEDEVEVKNE